MSHVKKRGQNEADGSPACRQADSPILEEAVMQSLEGRDIGVGPESPFQEAVSRLDLDPQTIKEKARSGYTAPPDVSANIPEESRFAWAYVALEKSRREWPPEPRRGKGYSSAQMREEIAHGPKGLPIRSASDGAAWRLKEKAQAQGIPETLFEGRSSWSPECSYMSLCKRVVRPLHPDKRSAEEEIEPIPEAIEAYAEEKLFEPMNGELQLWDWLLRRAGDIAEADSPTDAYRMLTEIKQIGRLATSAAALAERILYHCHDTVLGKTVFGSARKKPPYGDAADYDKDIPRFHEVWRGRSDVSFEEAQERRAEYEAAIERVERKRERQAAQNFKRDIKDTLFPFFSWHVGNGWSASSLQSLSMKWSEHFAEKSISPRLHRSDISGDIVIDGDGIRRRYVSPAENTASAETGARLLVHYIGHARRLLLLREVEDRSGLHALLRDAQEEARKDLARTKAAADLYEAVEQLIVDQATARPTGTFS